MNWESDLCWRAEAKEGSTLKHVGHSLSLQSHDGTGRIGRTVADDLTNNEDQREDDIENATARPAGPNYSTR